jgi:TfoX N-terminal domain
MAHDEGLAQRVREAVGDHPALQEKRMFGGVGFLIGGNMSCGVHKDQLIVRVGPERYDESLAKPHAREFDITGRVMKGWVMVGPEGQEDDAVLEEWVRLGVGFAESLPPK